MYGIKREFIRVVKTCRCELLRMNTVFCIENALKAFAITTIYKYKAAKTDLD